MGLDILFIYLLGNSVKNCIQDLPRLTILQKKIILYTKSYCLLTFNHLIFMPFRYILDTHV